MERQYAAFISYRHKPLDMAVAKRLHQLIERYRVPRQLRGIRGARLGIAFRDQEELPVSVNLSDDICTALKNSEFLVVVCTPDTRGSMWVQREITQFLQTHDHDHVLAVLAAGEPEDVFPEALTHVGEEIVEPLAADVRADSLGRTLRRLDHESLRLFAAFLGVPYDTLAQREQRRKRQRRLAIAATVFCVVLGYAAMLLRNNMLISRKNEELEAANLTLTQQKQELQMRESRLLTAEAVRAMAAGDGLGAVRSSVAALPDEDNDRPFYAPAEAALMSALHVLEMNISGHVYIHQTPVTLSAPILHMDTARDGKMVLTLDESGQLTAIEPQSGAILWQTYMIFNSRTRLYNEGDLWVNDAQDSVMVLCSGRVSVIALEDGKVLWQSPRNRNVDRAALSQDGSRLAYIGREFTDLNTFAMEYAVVFVDVATGKELLRLPMPEECADPTLNLDFGYAQYERNNMAFSEKSDYLAFVAYGKDSQTNAQMEYDLLADYSAQTLRVVSRREINRQAALWVLPVRQKDAVYESIFIASRADESLKGVTVREINCDTGETLWSVAGLPEQESEDYVSAYSVVNHVALQGSWLWASANENLYVFDLGGKRLVAKGVADNNKSIHTLYAESDDMMGVVLEDGLYQLLWSNGRVIFSSHGSGVVFTIAANTLCAQGGKGFVRSVVKNHTVESFSVNSLEHGYGFFATASEEDQRTLVINSALTMEGKKRQKLFQAPENFTLANLAEDASARLFENGIVVMCKQYQSGDDDIYEWDLVDVETGDILSTRTLKSDVLGSILPVLRGDGLVITNKSGTGSVAVAQQGQVQTLQESEFVVLYQRENVQFSDYKGRAVSCYRSADSVLQTAWCDGQSFKIWEDGGNEREIPLPQGAVWSYTDNTAMGMLLNMGGSGCVLLSDFSSGPNMANFLLYDPAAGWKTFADVARGNGQRRTAVGNTEAVFAVMEEHDVVLHIYRDPNAEPLSVYTNIASGMLCDCRFILQDRYIVLCDNDGHIEIIDAVSGSRVYEGAFNTPYTCQSVSASLDAEENRLYLIENRNHVGLCISFSSWEKLGDIKDAFCFDPVRGMLIFTQYRTLYAQPVPTLEELVEMGKRL